MRQRKGKIWRWIFREASLKLVTDSNRAILEPGRLKEKPQSASRNKSKDGRANKFLFWALTNLGPFWRLVQSVARLERIANRLIINSAVLKARTRPHPLSLMHDYSSWDSLTEQTFTGRHLPPAPDDYISSLPSEDDVAQRFARQDGKERLSDTSTQLFSHFAQWFTDGFLRTDRNDWRKNTSNHQIDLSQLYGRTRKITSALREKKRGRLKSQIIAGCEFPPFYFDKNGKPKKEFKDLDIFFFIDPDLPSPEAEARKKNLFAMGADRGNVQFGYAMLNTLFLREHNRLCDMLSKAHPAWSDERLFQTARNTVIVMVIKIVVEDYLNHIAPYHFSFKAQPGSFYKQKWYRNNWITLEFNLLYRWHGLVTNKVRAGNTYVDVKETRFNNHLLLDNGLARCIDGSSRERCGSIGLLNTHESLIGAEKASITLGRLARLQSYNSYREYCGFPAVTAFNQITGDPERQKALADLYGHPDKIEFYAGLFAEDTRPGSPLSPLIGRLVGIDAFSQALTNPLLSEHVFKSDTFSEVGWRELGNTKSLSDVVHRNLQNEKFTPKVTFAYGNKEAS